MRGYAAQIEREKIKERAMRGKRELAKSGKVHSWGSEMYGYRRDKERGVRTVYEPEATVVRQIFIWIATEGLSSGAVMRRLNDNGVPPPSAGKRRFEKGPVTQWCRGTVRVILTEPAYKGEAVAWRWTTVNRRIKATSESERIKLPPGVVPPIISAKLWQVAQERLKLNRGDWTRNQRHPDLLRGFIFCQVCGRRMTGENEHGYRIYRCSSRSRTGATCGGKRLRAEPCESQVWEKVKTILNNPDVIKVELERHQTNGPDTQLIIDLESARHALERIEKGQQRLIRRFREATNSNLWTLIEREIATAENEKKQLQSTVAELESCLAAQVMVTSNLETLSTYCANVANKLKSFSFDERRLALEALGTRIVANGREWQLEVSIPLDVNAGTLDNML